MRVVDGNEYIGTMEAPVVPAVGDSFFWKTNGPYEVLSRLWSFPEEYQSDRPELVTLSVRKILASG